MPPDRHTRSHMQHRLLHLRVRRARGQGKIAKYSEKWYLSPPHRVVELVKKASTRSYTYISFDPVTEHIASEMRLILHTNKGKAGVLYRACLDLPSTACPCFMVYGRCMLAWRAG